MSQSDETQAQTITDAEIDAAIKAKREQLREAGVLVPPRERHMRDFKPAVGEGELPAPQLIPARSEPGPVCFRCFAPTTVTYYAAPRSIGGEIAEQACSDAACQAESQREVEYLEWARERNAFRLERLQRKSELPRGFERLTFDSYEPDGNASLEEALREAKEYAGRLATSVSHNTLERTPGNLRLVVPEPEEPAEPPPSIIFGGPVGTGKTHMAVAILVHAIREHKMPALFVTVPRLLEAERERYGAEDGASGPGPFEEASKADLLVLDDLGADRGTEWAREKLFSLINHRYAHRMPTVATTNLGFEELGEALGGRVISRLAEMCEWVGVTGDDYRMKRMIASRRRERGQS